MSSTMVAKQNQFPEMAGKVIASVNVENSSSHRVLSIFFSDETAFHFSLNLRLDIEPSFLNWKTGDAEFLKEFPVIGEK